MSESPHPFQALTPGFIIDAVESQGFACDCRTLALNSYENRVYQVGIDEGQPLIAKFYRPGRWSDAQIIEEHLFCLELAEHELPVVPPWTNAAGESLFHHGGFRFALYPRQGGHAPEFDNLDNLLILGRMLGRIHRIGAVKPFAHRPVLDSQSFGHASVALIASRFIPEEYRESYTTVTAQLLEAIDACFTGAGPIRSIRNSIWSRGPSGRLCRGRASIGWARAEARKDEGRTANSETGDRPRSRYRPSGGRDYPD